MGGVRCAFGFVRGVFRWAGGFVRGVFRRAGGFVRGGLHGRVGLCAGVYTCGLACARGLLE